jgi:hypothetical protein
MTDSSGDIDTIDEKKATPSSLSLVGATQSLCEECKNKQALYQCPGCNIRSCSLECCRSHKRRTGCSGKRNRGAFLPLCRMSDSTLRSDYFFLEEVLDQIPRARKLAKLDPPTTDHHRNGGHSRHHPSTTGNNTNSNVNKKIRRLIQQAGRRGVTLQIMPPIMERHRNNTSWYCNPRDMITWKVEVIVIPSKTIISFSISESEDNILQQVSKHIINSSIDTVLGAAINCNDYHCYIKRLPSSANSPRYVQILPHDNLRTVLQGLTVIEYPTIYCVPNEMIDEFPAGTDMIVEQQKQGQSIDSTSPEDLNNAMVEPASWSCTNTHPAV